ncbi:MAG: tryptophan--tRNA ligase [Scrofimicrobium sp.]
MPETEATQVQNAEIGTQEAEAVATKTAADKVADAVSTASVRRAIERSREIEEQIALDPSQFRMLTGARPTGNLHVGHYFGTLINWVGLQNRGVETWTLIADYQVITDRDGVGPLKERVYGLVTDYLACGIDPEKTTIFTHSAVPALNQLMIPFLSLVTESELNRNPTVKAELEASGGRALSGLLLTYPVHQATDILFCKANIVPVGQDQLPHIELTRQIASRFDRRYGRAEKDNPVFRRPDALLSEAPLILGTDGEKMAKSRGNTIEIGFTADETAQVLKKAKTDSDRVITYDPVNRPEVSNLLMLAALASGGDPETIAAEIGGGGGGKLKAVVTEAVNEALAPVRARRQELAADTTYIHEVLAAGNEKANEEANRTLGEVRQAMAMIY